MSDSSFYAALADFEAAVAEIQAYAEEQLALRLNNLYFALDDSDGGLNITVAEEDADEDSSEETTDSTEEET